MKNIACALMFLISSTTYGQTSKLSIFDNLVAKTWKAEGNWGDGSKFEQEIKFEYSLDSTVVITNAIGFVDKEQTKIGLRNHGIRQFDKQSENVKFWEFDVFGGLTKGIVFSEGENIIYQYEYGGTMVTDMWEYVDDSTYNFKVGSYEDGAWKQLYLDIRFKEVEEK